MSSTAILILNWNGSEDTIGCLRSLLPDIDTTDFVFIIDNGSTDDSVEKILSYLKNSQKPFAVTKQQDLVDSFSFAKKIYLITNENNLGFGGGNNVVLEKLNLLDPNVEFAWLLNNDAVVTQTSLQSLKKNIQKDKAIGAVGSLILNLPDNGAIQCSGVQYYKFFGVSKLINKNKPFNDLDKNQKIKFDYLNGASLLLRLSALKRTGYFDERFFLYSEELDLQLRLQNLDYKLALDLDSIVYHKLGGGTKKKKYLFYYYYNTSAVLLSRKHNSFFYTFCAVVNLTFITFIRTFPSLNNFKWGVKGILEGMNLK